MDKYDLKYIADLGTTANGKKIITDSKGHEFAIDGDGDVQVLKPNYSAESFLQLHTLTGIVDYIKSNDERSDSRLIISISNPGSVSVFSPLDEYGHRECLAEAAPMVDELPVGQYMDRENMNIALQAKFNITDDLETILQVIGNLTDSSVTSASDDGVSQAVTVKTGVASQGTVKVPNPVLLEPRRTFIEVDQPKSQFIFRMREGMQCALITADGNAWRNEAIQNIKVFFENELEDQLKSGKVWIIA